VAFLFAYHDVWIGKVAGVGNSSFVFAVNMRFLYDISRCIGNKLKQNTMTKKHLK
jgi:hypothetical protein